MENVGKSQLRSYPAIVQLTGSYCTRGQATSSLSLIPATLGPMKNTRSSGALTASFSFGDGEKSSAPPLFVFIAPDKDFKKPPFPGSRSHAELLEGKMYRKVGSSKVVPLHAAVDPDGPWARALQHPTPTLHMLYRKHPVRDDSYIGIKQFHSVIMDEKRYNVHTVLYRLHELY